MTTLAIKPCQCGGAVLMAFTIQPRSLEAALVVEFVTHVDVGDPALALETDWVTKAWAQMQARKENTHGK